MPGLRTQPPEIQTVGNQKSITSDFLSKWWRFLRSLVEIMVPKCACEAIVTPFGSPPASFSVTGTFVGQPNGRVKLCVQEDPRSHPVLFLELPFKTSQLANEMETGVTRIALECDRESLENRGPLFDAPAWVMYCNGRKVGFATRRQMTEDDAALLESMQTVSTGVTILPGKSNPGAGKLFFWRANFRRITGSVDSESFHLSIPHGSTDHELSIFLLRP